MNIYGWCIMIFSISFVLALLGYCLYRVITLPPLEEEHLKGPLEIDTGDTDDTQ